MSKKQRIIIALGDEDLSNLLQLMLEDQFELDIVALGAEVLISIQSSGADMVLIDTELPDISGLEICRRASEQDTQDKLPFIFLSKQEDDDVIREAYAIGAHDYFCVPVNIVAFHEHLLRFARELESLSRQDKQEQQNNDITEMVMKQAAFYGQGLELVAALNTCANESEIAKVVGKTFLGLGITCALFFQSETERLYLNENGDACEDIDVRIFDLLRNQGRIYNFGRRCIFNDKNVSILVKNMPVEGSSSYDAAIDMLAKFIPALEIRLYTLQQKTRLYKTREALVELMHTVNRGFDEIQKEKQAIIESIETRVGLSFHKLDLQDHQEAFFLELIDQEIKQKLSGGALNDIRQVVSDTLNTIELEQVEEEQTAAPIEDNTTDIELF